MRNMSNRNIIILTATAALLTACGPKTQEYTSENGSVKAINVEGTDQWKILDANGKEPIADYDSMRVVERGEAGHPKTVVYYRGNERHQFQYYSTMQPYSEEHTVAGVKQGRWAYYHPNGNLWAETNFKNGVEDGPYRSMRENGAPNIIGNYTNGVRTGTWEIYDQSGNLVRTIEY